MINEGRPTTSIDKSDGWTARTIDNKLSAQFEHTILVTETGFEVLTDVHDEYPVT
jgi:methionyl aminopeptidase